jgi:DNA-binding winged helix-turn-helix (wHTH) protein/tetratricopeptide (TPR) repeat protein
MTGNGEKIIEFADFAFETQGNLLIRRGVVVPLEPMVARVLRYFLESGGRLVSKEELLETVWCDVFTTEDVLKRAVSQIRRVLGDDVQNPRFIETHHRRGYRFIAAPKSKNQPEPIHLTKFVNPEKEVESDPNFDCFVGREEAIVFLQTEFRRVQKGFGQPVLLVGEPGIGKTQTAVRFSDWAKETHNAIPLKVRFFDYEAAYLPPYDLFLDLLGEACAKIFEVNETNLLKGKTLFEFVESELNVRLPDELLLNSPEVRQSADASRIIAPLAECFARLSQKNPLIFIFDDVQWADEMSRQIIGYLMRIAADVPLMIIGLARRAEAENTSHTLAEWLQKQAVYRSYTILELAPLSTENCREVIQQVFRGQLDTQSIPTAEIEKLQQATGGNPYFLVETIRLLINKNVIEKVTANDDFKWFWHGIKDIPLPETIRIAARAKLNNLLNETRDLIEFAAVLGDTFQLKTLETMRYRDAGQPPHKLFDENLDEAITAQILTEFNVSGADDCQFYHTTLRRAIYADLSPRRRKRLHSYAFSAIAEVHKNEPERFAAALAAHAENADDFEKSLHWNIIACRTATVRYNWAEASELADRAERVFEKSAGKIKISAAEKLKFLALCGEVYLSIGRRSDAEKILVEAKMLAESDEKTNLKDAANILLNLGRTRILLGKYREAGPVLEKCLMLALEINDNFIASSALIQLASEKYALCEYEASCQILEKIITEEPPESYNRAVALGKIGWVRALQSRFAEAKKLLTEAFAFHQTAGDLRERTVLLMCLNWCEYGMGDYETAIESAMRSRYEAQIIGEPYNETVALMRVAKARIAQGLYQEAENLLLGVWEKQKNLEAMHAKAETLWMLGRTQIFLQNYESAADNLDNALEMIRVVGDRDDEFRILIDQAHLANYQRNFANAIILLSEAIKIADELKVGQGIGEILIVKTQALINTGKTEKAVSAAREAVRLLEICGAGERGNAYYLLASALLAQRNSTKSVDGKRRKPSAPKDIDEQIETFLRRSLDVLEVMHNQFSVEDESRRRQSTISLNAPAKDLYNFLTNAGRLPEAAEIRQRWLLDN